MKKLIAILLSLVLAFAGGYFVGVSTTSKEPHLNYQEKTIQIGDNFHLKLIDGPAHMKWESLNKEVATVSSNGDVKGIKEGKAVITCKTDLNVYRSTIIVRDNSVKEKTADNLYSSHGKLAVKDNQLVDEEGNAFVLKGASTHGLAWYPQYVNKEAFKTLKSWGANVIRLAMYTQEYGGYLNGGDQNKLKSLIDTGVQSTKELGMYCVIDWHILSDGNPLDHKAEAIKFFDEISQKYKDEGHVIYEICNEPNGHVQWNDVKSYATDVITTIRSHSPDALIIVGTPTWSQDVDVAASNPISGNNIAYSCHYYAATHKNDLRNKITNARNKGLCIIISEYSITDASGNGNIDKESSKEWADYIDNNKLSYIQWSLSNKDESSALIKSTCTKTSGWDESDLTDTGKYLKQRLSSNY